MVYLIKFQESKLKIFNLRSRVICDLSERVFIAGVHKTNWDSTDFNGDHVPTGNYLVYMVISDHVYTQRITIIK
jgi:flagellar hook assembly protein FlgD